MDNRKPGHSDFGGHEIANSGFRLADGQARAAEHPNSFEVPNWAELNQLTEGSVIKLIVEPLDPDVMTERMWFRILELPKVGWSGIASRPGVAECLSTPFDGHAPVEYGDCVIFEMQNVIDIYESQTSEVSK